jgi:hypothetical protein
MSTATAIENGLPRRRAVAFIILLGMISLFADMTYEGARSITGPYLGVLGVTATTIGVVSGLGELVGYAVRLASGYLADRSGRYWAVTIFGYLLNLLAVPLLALAGNWQIAVILIIAERMGRAIRSPPRDAMLSHAAGQTGLGWGFGLHQALDQLGAVVGPLIVSGVLSSAVTIARPSPFSSLRRSYRFRLSSQPACCSRGRTISIWRRRRSKPRAWRQPSGSTSWQSRLSPPAMPILR